MFFFIVRSLIGRLLGSFVHLFPTKENKIAKLHLDLFLPRKSKDNLLKNLYQNLIQSVFESLDLKPILKNHQKYIEFNQIDLVNSWLDRKKGIVCFTAHTGNWDLLAAYMASYKIPLTVIGKDLRNNSLNNFVIKLREKYGVKLLLRSDKKAVIQIINELKEGRVIAALIDQDTKVTSLPTNFFGLQVATPSTLASIAKKESAIIVYAFIVRTSFIKFKIYLGELDSSKEVNEILNDYNKKLEEIIRAHPSQWVWFHKRWRTNAVDYTMSSKEYLDFLKNLAKKKL